MRLSEIRSTATNAFTRIVVVRDEERAKALDDLAGDNEELLAMINKRRNVGVEPLTPEFADQIKKQLEDFLRVKLFGRGFVNPEKISFQADLSRLTQMNHEYYWRVEDKIQHLAPRGYKISLFDFEPDDFVGTGTDH